MDAGIQVRRLAHQGDPTPRRRAPDRGGRRKAARHDAVDQGRRAGRQVQELIENAAAGCPGRLRPAMIVPVTDVDIRFVAEPWPVPAPLRAQVPAIWARLVAANPHLWDGRILGVSGVGGGPPRVDASGELRVEAREDSFSAFMAWRDLGWPEIGLRNVFGSAVVISSDGAVLLGLMGGTTANAGQIYPPAGSLEPGDVVGGRVDLFASLARELAEGTGLDAAEARAGVTVAIID